MRTTALILVLLALATSIVACADDKETSNPTATTAAAATPAVVVWREPEWWTPWANSIDTLFHGRTVVIGRVTGVALPFDPSVRLYTVYSVEVSEVLHGDSISAGEIILVGQTGGIWDGVAYQDKDSALFKRDTTYMLAVSEISLWGPDVGFYSSHPFAQFAVADGVLTPKDDAWSHLPAVDELAGSTLDEARGILAAIVPPTPIPDQTLQDTYHSIPLPQGVDEPHDPLVREGAIHGGFTTRMTADEIFDFYEEQLTTAGWLPETAREETTYPNQGAGPNPNEGAGPKKTANWTLSREDLRLVIALDLTPKNLPTGHFAAVLRVEPVWASGLDESGIPSPYAPPIAFPASYPPNPTPPR